EERLRRASLARDMADERVDTSLPGPARLYGRLHPTMQTLRLIVAAFRDMGFQVWELPEDVELDEYNYSLLNFPPDHPARDMQDTLYVETPPGDDQMLLRTHTSPGQIRMMRRYAPNPVRLLLPGRCHRSDQIDASHESMFYHFEFLAVGHG